MKKLITICLFIAITFTVKAQNKNASANKSGPTKEQTLEYLKAALENVWGGFSSNRDGDLTEWEQTLEGLTMNGCILKLKIKNTTTINKESCTWCSHIDHNKEIDISLVESVQTKKIGKTPLGDNLGLYFIVKNKPIQVKAYCKPEDSEKVLKAFNHLRKLCGAPEPISFD